MDRRKLERSDTVLWTIAPPGIVLHNFSRRLFFELDEIGYKIWGFLDGARIVDDVIVRCIDIETVDKKSKEECERKIREIIDLLFSNGFVRERAE